MSSLEQVKVEQEIIEILSYSLVPADRLIGLNSQLIEDLCVDSMALVEMVLELNARYGIELSEKEIVGWREVRDICGSVLGCMELR